MEVLKPGDIVLMVGADGRRRLITLQENQAYHTHRGTISHSELIGKPPGRVVSTQLGYPYLVLEPGVADLIQNIKRITQIVYPKDAAYIVMRLNLSAGKRVLEAGTGSGGLTIALAKAVMPGGHVVSCEVREDIHRLAARNLEKLGLLPYVTLFNRDLSEGCDVEDIDAVFLDMKEPWQHLGYVEEVLRPGGFFGSLLPTTNQVSALLDGLSQHNFMDISVEELLLRPYKPVAERLRPTDRMVAHSGYLIFARRVETSDEARRWFSPIRRMHRDKYLGKGEGEENA